MVRDRSRECLTTGLRTKLAIEAERLHYGEVRLDGKHRHSSTLLFAEDLTAMLVEHRVDTAATAPSIKIKYVSISDDDRRSTTSRVGPSAETAPVSATPLG